MKMKTLLIGLLSVAALGVGSESVWASWFCGHKCKACVCCSQYNAFSDFCCSCNISCHGCCPMQTCCPMQGCGLMQNCCGPMCAPMAMPMQCAMPMAPMMQQPAAPAQTASVYGQGQAQTVSYQNQMPQTQPMGYYYPVMYYPMPYYPMQMMGYGMPNYAPQAGYGYGVPQTPAYGFTR